MACECCKRKCTHPLKQTHVTLQHMSILTSTFAHIGIVSVGPSSGSGNPDPVCTIPRPLDHSTDVLTLKVT